MEVRLVVAADPMQAEVPLTLAARLLHIERRQEGAAAPVWRQGVRFEGGNRDERMLLQNFLLRQRLEG